MEPDTPSTDGLPVRGGVSERLWFDAQDAAYRALQHPFIVALGLGTLPRCVAWFAAG
jgi:hypothetical protein